MGQCCGLMCWFMFMLFIPWFLMVVMMWAFTWLVMLRMHWLMMWWISVVIMSIGAFMWMTWLWFSNWFLWPVWTTTLTAVLRRWIRVVVVVGTPSRIGAFTHISFPCQIVTTQQTFHGIPTFMGTKEFRLTNTCPFTQWIPLVLCFCCWWMKMWSWHAVIVWLLVLAVWLYLLVMVDFAQSQRKEINAVCSVNSCFLSDD